MRVALTASFAIHAGLLAYALFWIPAVAPLEVKPQDSIPVEIVSIDDFAAKKAQSKDAPEKKQEKPKPKPQETSEEAKPKDKVAPEKVEAAHEKNVEKDTPKPKEKPAPEVKPEEPKPLDTKQLASLLEDEPPPVKKEEPKPKETEKPKEPEKPKEEPKPDQAALDAVLKQTVDEQAVEEAARKAEAEEAAAKKAEAEVKKKADAEAKKKAEAEAKKKTDAEAKKKAEAKKAAEAEAKKKQSEFDTAAIGDLLNKIPDEQAAPAEKAKETGTPDAAERDTSGEDKELKATLGQAVGKHIYDCWTIPPGAKEAGISVKIRFKLAPDGTVQGQPQILNNGDALFDATARSAVAAIFKCENYDFLPPDKYELWKQFTINFRPESDAT